jgi:hypothetical protein
MYQAIFRDCADDAKFLEYPYFFALFGVVTSVVQYCVKTGQPTQPIDFIFDSQPDQMLRVLAAWELFVANSPETLRPFLRTRPIFRDDKTVLPLQAADLHAWWMRRSLDTYLRDKPELEPPFPGKKASLTIPGAKMLWKADSLMRMRALLETGSIPISFKPLPLTKR